MKNGNKQATHICINIEHSKGNVERRKQITKEWETLHLALFCYFMPPQVYRTS